MWPGFGRESAPCRLFAPQSCSRLGFRAVGALSDGDSTVVTIRADEREQCVPILWRGFGPGPQSISSSSGGLADRGAARRADAPGATLPLRGGSMRAAHLHGTLRRQHPQALGASHGSAGSDCPLFRDRPWRSAGGEFRAPLEHTGQQRHPVARRAQTRQPELRAAGDHRDRRLGLALQPSLWNADL